MSAGSTITSRESHEVRHIAAARQARSGRPRWKNDARSPPPSSASTSIAPARTKRSFVPRKSSAPTSARNRPCPAPASVVKRMTDQAGFKCGASFPRQVMVRRLGLPLGHERVAAVLADRARGLRVRIVDIAEEPRARRARHDARGLALRLGQARVVDAVDAQRALLHHLLGAVELARAVRAGPGAVAAADALVVVDEHDAALG